MLTMRKEKNELSSNQEKNGKISKFSEVIVVKGGFAVTNAGTFSSGVRG